MHQTITNLAVNQLKGWEKVNFKRKMQNNKKKKIFKQ